MAVSVFTLVSLDTAGGYSYPLAHLRETQSDIALREGGDNVVAANLTDADFGDGSSVSVSGMYRVA
jgi:hypothetical protein